SGILQCGREVMDVGSRHHGSAGAGVNLIVAAGERIERVDADGLETLVPRVHEGVQDILALGWNVDDGPTCSWGSCAISELGDDPRLRLDERERAACKGVRGSRDEVTVLFVHKGI